MLANSVHILIDTDGGSDDLAAIGIAIAKISLMKILTKLNKVWRT